MPDEDELFIDDAEFFNLLKNKSKKLNKDLDNIIEKINNYKRVKKIYGK